MDATNMQVAFDQIKAWVDSLLKENEALKNEVKMLREVLAVNKVDIGKSRVNLQSKYDERLNEVLDDNFDWFGLSVRSYNCLKAAEIRTVRDLLMYTRPQLLKMRNFGRKSIAEIDRMLDKLSERTGLTLSYGMIPPTDIKQAEWWYWYKGGRLVVDYGAWRDMSEEEKITACKNHLI